MSIVLQDKYNIEFFLSPGMNDGSNGVNREYTGLKCT